MWHIYSLSPFKHLLQAQKAAEGEKHQIKSSIIFTLASQSLKTSFYKGASLKKYSNQSVESQDFSPLKAGIFCLAVGHVVKALVIGSGCPGLGSNPMCHAAFATNKTAPAGRNSRIFSSCDRKRIRCEFNCLRIKSIHTKVAKSGVLLTLSLRFII